MTTPTNDRQAELEVERLLVEAGGATHKCSMCDHVGIEDPIVGCLLCGWDEMVPLTRRETP